jgi:hypothetical protein
MAGKQILKGVRINRRFGKKRLNNKTKRVDLKNELFL